MNNYKTKDMVMEKISSGKIKMRPRWQFLAQIYGMKSLTVLMLFGSSLVLATMVYLVEIDHPLELFSYGEVGRAVFLDDFPSLLFLASIILGMGGILLYSKIGTHYKKNMKKLLLLITGLLLLLTLFLTATRVLLYLNHFFG